MNLKSKLMVMFGIIAFMSCEKEDYKKEQIRNETVQYTLDNIPNISNPYSANLYVKNELDIDDEKINKQLLDIAIATRDFLKESPQNEFILKSANISSNSSMNLFDLVSNSNLKSANQGVAYTNLVSLLEKSDLTHASTNPFKSGEIEEYIPAIYVPNINNSDLSKQPIVCVGFEVDSDISGMEKYEGYIVGWYFDEEGSVHEILLNEKTAMSTSNPIYIINNSSIGFSYGKKPFLEKGGASIRTSTSQVIDQYKINYRYDRSNRSEYSYNIVYIYNGGGYQHGGYRTEIREIHKNDIGKMFYDDYNIWQISSIGNLYSINLVTFEYDWYASEKPVYSPGGIFVQCRMKYYNEYYQSFQVLMSDSYTTNGSKGYIKVKKQ